MLITAILLMLAIGAGTLLALVRTIGIERLPLAAPMLEFVWGFTGKLIALGLLASLFYVFYCYAPARTLSRRALLVASLSATILFELARWGFAWYVTFAHEALALYGVLGGLMFFFFWLYYASLVFVLGAEAGFAYEQTRLFEPPYARRATPYSTLTLISLVLASSVLGSLTSKMPFLKEALILSACTSLGSSTDRRKAP